MSKAAIQYARYTVLWDAGVRQLSSFDLAKIEDKAAMRFDDFRSWMAVVHDVDTAKARAIWDFYNNKIQ